MENETAKTLKGKSLCYAVLTVFLYECAGTCLLMYAVVMGAVSSNLWCPALALFLICCSIGPITGGHVNPAVTLGVLLLKYNHFCSNLGWAAVAILA